MTFVEKLIFYKINISDIFYLSRTYFSRGRENAIFLIYPFLFFTIFSVSIFTIYQTISIKNTISIGTFNVKYLKNHQFLCQFLKNNFPNNFQWKTFLCATIHFCIFGVFVVIFQTCSRLLNLSLRHDFCRKTQFLQHPCLRHNFNGPEHTFPEAAKTRFFLSTPFCFSRFFQFQFSLVSKQSPLKTPFYLDFSK